MGWDVNVKEVKKAKEDFIEWCFRHANDYDIGRYELAQEVWMKKEEEIVRLNKIIEKLQRSKK